MRSLLEIIASGSLQSIEDLDVFLKNTLKYTLCTRAQCPNCVSHMDFNKALFGDRLDLSQKEKKRIFDKF